MNDKVVVKAKFAVGLGLFYILLGMVFLLFSVCLFTSGVPDDCADGVFMLICGGVCIAGGIFLIRYKLEISPLGCVYRSLWKKKTFTFNDIAVLKLYAVPVYRAGMNSLKMEAYGNDGKLLFKLKGGRKFAEVLEILCQRNIPVEVVSGMDVYAPMLSGTASWKSVKAGLSGDMNPQYSYAKTALPAQGTDGYAQGTDGYAQNTAGYAQGTAGYAQEQAGGYVQNPYGTAAPAGYVQEPAAEESRKIARVTLTAGSVMMALLWAWIIFFRRLTEAGGYTAWFVLPFFAFGFAQILLSNWAVSRKTAIGCKEGRRYNGTISRFEKQRNGIVTYITFTDETGLQHEVPANITMKVKGEKQKELIGKSYRIWYAPEQIDVVILADDQDRPIKNSNRSQFIGFLIICIIMMAFFFAVQGPDSGSSPTDEQGKALDAWDYVRELKLLGQCYDCGYISLQECLDQSLPVARKMQSEFGSWSELYQSYVYGYRFWNRKGDSDRAMHASYYQDNVDILSMEEKDEVSDDSLTEKYELGDYQVELCNTWGKLAAR